MNKTLIKDEENYARYVLYLNKLETCTKFKINDFSLSEVDIIKLNITNSSIIKILEKISDEDYINYINYINKSTGYNSTGINEEIIQEMNILNDYLSNLCEEAFNQEIKFINETAIILDCVNNLYYTNYLNMTFFNNFNEEISHNLSEISDKYKDIINSFYVGTEFIEDYIISSNYIKLENYENFPTKYLITNIENFNDMSEYIQYDCEIKYNNYMKQTLIEIFNNSFTEFMKNAISGDIEDNFLFYVFSKIEINIKYIIEKVQNETDYYTLLLNKTKELGITSKKALISLYDYIGDRVNKSLQYQIEDYIGDNIIFFYRENKFLFRDYFINYYLKNSNKMFNVDNIFNLRSILHEFIVSRDFNKSLDNISKDLWNIWLIDNLNNKIQKILDSTISNLTAILKQQQNIIIRELENVETAELYESMLLLAEMIDNYTALVNEQNNRFKFIVSNSPMEKFSNFSSNYLEPPLSEIKEYYDMIQNELLKKINEIVSEMSDFYAEIETKYNITEQINEMFNVLQDTYNTLVNYSQILIDDINNYDDILVLYTFIGSSSNDMRRLNNYLRSNEKNIKKIRNIFNFTNNNSKNKRTKKMSENDEINKNLRINNNQINNMPNSGIRKLNSFKKLSHNKQKNYNSFKKTSSNQKFSHSKKKRKLSTHSAQGSVSEATLNKESQKLMKTLKNFNKTYLSSDFLKINSNLLKEETNINKYILNSGRTIDLSVMKLASIITEDKQDELKEILYYKHKQISSHVYKFMNLTCNQTYLYQYLLRNSSEMLEYTHIEIDYIILTDFKIIKELIVGQIKEYEGDARTENIDINERLFDLFQNDDLYKPVGFNNFNYTNNTNNIINFTLRSTINKYHKLFKMSKSRLLNFTDQKYKQISDNEEEAKKYIINKRRMSEDKQENEKNNNKEDEFEEEQEIGLDILKGELSFQYSFKLEKDFSGPLKNLPIFQPITILSPLIILLEPEIILGFEIQVEFTTKLYDEIKAPKGINIKLGIENDDDDDDKKKKDPQTFFPDGFDYEVDEEEEEEEEEEKDKIGDTKLTITVEGKGEVSLAVNAGIGIGVPGVFSISFLTGIQGLLGSGKIGFSLELNLRKLEFTVDSYFVIKAFYITFFLKLKFEINVIFTKLEFEIYIFQQQIEGLKYEKHNIVKKNILKLIFMALKFDNYLNNMIK